MKVLSNHGINDLKAICARVSSAVTLDSAITPLIGPLTYTSVLSFQYRIIDQSIYPSTPTNLDDGDSIEILISTDSVNYHTVFLITDNNHNTSFNFVKKKVFLSQYAGSNANFKIRCHYGTGTSFYVDIDTVAVKNEPQTGIEDLSNETSFSLYPNPTSSQFTVCSLQVFSFKKTYLNVYDVSGREIHSEVFTSAYCQLPTANWQPGIYFVQIGNLTRKLIVE